MTEEPHAEPTPTPEAPVFRERLTGAFAPDAAWTAGPLLALAGVLALLGWLTTAAAVTLLAIGVALFFRNPERRFEGDPLDVVAPADGRVIAAGEIELPGGEKALRVGIFLSIFDVHVNRAPVAGRVVAVEHAGRRYRPAFDRRAEADNVRTTLVLETERGERVRVVQTVGLVARRIVCHPKVGEWVARGARYGLIRFGSRTDVVLPPGGTVSAVRGQRVRGGSSVVGRLEGTS